MGERDCAWREHQEELFAKMRHQVVKHSGFEVCVIVNLKNLERCFLPISALMTHTSLRLSTSFFLGELKLHIIAGKLSLPGDAGFLSARVIQRQAGPRSFKTPLVCLFVFNCSAMFSYRSSLKASLVSIS
jgi:hypothetical protein